MLNQHKHFQDHGLEFRKRIVGAELARRVKKNIRVSISDQTARVANLACSLGLGVQFQVHGSWGGSGQRSGYSQNVRCTESRTVYTAA